MRREQITAISNTRSLFLPRARGLALGYRLSPASRATASDRCWTRGLPIPLRTAPAGNTRIAVPI